MNNDNKMYGSNPNRNKTDYEIKNEIFKKVDLDGVLKQWEFKAKGKTQVKFFTSFKQNCNNVREEFVSWIDDTSDPQIAYEKVPY